MTFNFFHCFHQQVHPGALLQAEDHSSGANSGQKVVILPLQWLRLFYPSIHTSLLQFYMVQVCSEERETLVFPTNQTSGMFWFGLDHQSLQNGQMFWGRCVCIQSHVKTEPSASSVFANLETFIGEKKKIICSHRHDLKPPV